MRFVDWTSEPMSLDLDVDRFQYLGAWTKPTICVATWFLQMLRSSIFSFELRSEKTDSHNSQHLVFISGIVCSDKSFVKCLVQ